MTVTKQRGLPGSLCRRRPLFSGEHAYKFPKTLPTTLLLSVLLQWLFTTVFVLFVEYMCVNQTRPKSHIFGVKLKRKLCLTSDRQFSRVSTEQDPSERSSSRAFSERQQRSRTSRGLAVNYTVAPLDVFLTQLPTHLSRLQQTGQHTEWRRWPAPPSFSSRAEWNSDLEPSSWKQRFKRPVVLPPLPTLLSWLHWMLKNTRHRKTRPPRPAPPGSTVISLWSVCDCFPFKKV